MSKTLMLDNSLLTEQFFEHSILWGISTPLQGYDLCHVLNVSLRLQLTRRIDMDINITKEVKAKANGGMMDLFESSMPEQLELVFPVYYQQLPFCETDVHVYANRKDGNLLIHHLKNTDYLVLVRNGNYFPQLQQIDQYLADVRRIDACQRIHFTNEKWIEYLIT